MGRGTSEKTKERWARLNPFIDEALYKLTAESTDNNTYFTSARIKERMCKIPCQLQYDISVAPFPVITNRLEALVIGGKASRVFVERGSNQAEPTRAYRSIKDNS